MKQLEKIKEILDTLKQDTITPKEIESFLKFVLETIKNEKSTIIELTEKQKETLERYIVDIENKLVSLDGWVDEKIENTRIDFTTGANTNPVDVSGAVFTYVANAIYRIWVMGRINSTAATTGIGLHFNFSTAITDINVHTIHPLATSTTATAYSISDDASEGVSTGVPAGPLDVPFRSEALFRPGNNTGTCQLRFRAEVAAVTELLAGVTMIVERIA